MEQRRTTAIFLFIGLAFSVCFLMACAVRPTAATPVTRVTYSSTGGRAGNYESLNLSPDSLLYTWAVRGEEQTLRERTAPDTWKELIASINLADLQLVKSEGGHALYDGIDITLTVETPARTYTVINGEADSLHYPRLRSFTDKLEQVLTGLRKKKAP